MSCLKGSRPGVQRPFISHVIKVKSFEYILWNNVVAKSVKASVSRGVVGKALLGHKKEES